MIDMVSIMAQLNLLLKGLFFFGIVGVVGWWLIDKIMWRYNAIIIDRRDTTGKVVTFDKASIKMDKDGKMFAKLAKNKGYIEAYPNKFIYHSAGMMKKGLIVVNKIGEGQYIQGSLNDARKAKIKVPQFDEDGNPVLKNNKPVMVDSEVDVVENAIKSYQPTVEFLTSQAKRNIERHKKLAWWKENANLILSIAMIALIAFMFLMNVKYGNNIASANQQAVSKMAEANENLYKAMIAFRDRDCKLSMVAPEDLVSQIRQKRAENATKAQGTAISAVDKWLKK